MAWFSIVPAGTCATVNTLTHIHGLPSPFFSTMLSKASERIQPGTGWHASQRVVFTPKLHKKDGR
jgi:hypothetical protein